MKKLSVFLLLFVVLTIPSYAEQLKVTPEHPFYLDGEWVEASELKPGDKLKTIDGKTAVIKNIQKVETQEPITVYNLEDDFYLHNYVVGEGLVVHNSQRVPVGFKKSDWKSFKQGRGRYLSANDDPNYKGGRCSLFKKACRKLFGRNLAKEIESHSSRHNFLTRKDVLSYRKAVKKGDEAKIQLLRDKISKKHLGKAFLEGRRDLTLSDVDPEAHVYRGTAKHRLTADGEVSSSQVSGVFKSEGAVSDYSLFSIADRKELAQAYGVTLDQMDDMLRFADPGFSEVYISSHPSYTKWYALNTAGDRPFGMWRSAKYRNFCETQEPLMLRIKWKDLFAYVGDNKPIRAIKPSFNVRSGTPTVEYIIELRGGQKFAFSEYFKVK